MVEKLTKNPENRRTGIEVIGPRNTAPCGGRMEINSGGRRKLTSGGGGGGR